MSGAVLGKSERLSMPEAIVGYTRNGAYLTFEENLKGTLEPGRLADMVVLSEDLLTIDPAGILGAEVHMTFGGGKLLYDRRRRLISPIDPDDLSAPSTRAKLNLGPPAVG